MEDRSSSSPETRAAYLEEVNEDTQVVLPETRQTASTASTAANTTAKRSKPDAIKPKSLRDEFSDSGYSSRTAATLNSGESSSLASQRGHFPLPPAPAPPNVGAGSIDSNSTGTSGSSNTLRKARTTSRSRSQSPEKKPLQRTGSKSKGNGPTRTRTCGCPKCSHKQPHRGTAGVDANRLESVENSNSKSKPKKSGPILPQLQRISRPYPPKDVPTVDATQSLSPTPPPPPPPLNRTRPSIAQGHQRVRPMSFHAGTVPDGFFMNTPPVLIERQPTPRFPTASPMPPPSYPPNASFFPHFQMQSHPHEFYPPLPSPFEAPLHPLTRSWTAERPRPLRPQSMYYDSSASYLDYGQPIYEVAEPPLRLPERQRSLRRNKVASERDRAKVDEDLHRMPPPLPPPPKSRSVSRPRNEQRPIIRHAATTTPIYAAPQFPFYTWEQEEAQQRIGRSTSRKKSLDDYEATHTRSRRPSMGRAPRTSDEKVAYALQAERDRAQLKVERDSSSTRSRRRSSLYGRGSLHDLQGSIEEAEAYQASRGNTSAKSASTPVAEEILRLTKKKTRTSSSGGGSKASGHSKASRDGGSGARTSRRASDEDKKRDDDDQGLEMRIPKGVNFKLETGFEGRTVQVRSSRDGDGDMQLRIGERGSVAGSRSALREKSRRRYSVVESQALVESDSPQFMGRLIEGIYREDKDDMPQRSARDRLPASSRVQRNNRLSHTPREEAEFF